MLRVAGVLVYACEVREGRRQCRQTCAARGVAEFIYVPADSRNSREPECICREPRPDAPAGG